MFNMRLRNWIFYERIATKGTSAELTISLRKVGLVLLDAPLYRITACVLLSVFFFSFEERREHSLFIIE